MKRKFAIAVIFFALCVIVGCEWEAYNDDEVWSDRFGWINFTGIYRGTSGSLLVTDFDSTTVVTPGTIGQTNSVTGELIAYGNGSNTVFTGTLDGKPVSPGTVAISTAGYQFTDDRNGILNGTAGATGTITYETGAWSLDFGGAVLGNGVPIIAAYQFIVAPSSGSSSKSNQGNSGLPIYAFYIQQLGNQLTFTDNNGAVYNGYIINEQTSTGVDDPSVASGVVWAQFTVNGTGAMANVKIEGLLSGYYTPPSTTTDDEENQTSPGIATFSSLSIDATWYEQKPKKVIVGNIYGTADASTNVPE